MSHKLVDYNRQSERSPYNMTVGAYLTLGERGVWWG